MRAHRVGVVLGLGLGLSVGLSLPAYADEEAVFPPSQRGGLVSAGLLAYGLVSNTSETGFGGGYLVGGSIEVFSGKHAFHFSFGFMGASYVFQDSSGDVNGSYQGVRFDVAPRFYFSDQAKGLWLSGGWYFSFGDSRGDPAESGDTILSGPTAGFGYQVVVGSRLVIDPYVSANVSLNPFIPIHVGLGVQLGVRL